MNISNREEALECAKILQELINFALADKILSSFITRFKEAPLASDGAYYIFGSFNLGGTVSGRLSASGGLNLQTIPSGSKFAKVIKRCFIAPPNMIFCGSDFDALEDVVNTLLTKDPEKRKVLCDGFDGHCWRSVNYFPDRMPEVIEALAEINKIGQTFKVVYDDGTIKYLNANHPDLQGKV